MGTNRFRVRKPVITAVVAASAIAATGLAVQQTAMASTNGQHIQLCTVDMSRGLYKVDIKGNNQNGEYVEATRDVGVNDLSSGGCTGPDGWWWKGKVNITWQYVSHASVTTTCDVPEYWTWDAYPCSDG
jgi:hypothetical protein